LSRLWTSCVWIICRTSIPHASSPEL
jgi:hypothetical protein